MSGPTGKGEFFIEEVELKYGTGGKPWAKVTASFPASDFKTKEEFNVPLKLTAFGEHAHRLASVKGQNCIIEFEMGGNQWEGKTYPQYTVKHCHRIMPWPTEGAAPKSSGVDFAKRVAPKAPPPPPPQEQEDDLPF